MRKFNKLQGHIYYFKPEEFAKMLEKFNLQTIYGLEYAAEMYKMYKYREYTFEEFIIELNKRHVEAEQSYDKMKKEKAPFSLKELNITAQNLIDIGFKGDKIGKTLRKLLVHCAVYPKDNNREKLVRLALEF